MGNWTELVRTRRGGRVPYPLVSVELDLKDPGTAVSGLFFSFVLTGCEPQEQNKV